MSDPVVYSFITKILCSNGGYLDLKTIPQYLELSGHQLEQILRDSGQERFVVNQEGTSCQVLAVSPVRLCRRHECDGCEQLHVCKNYIKSRCYRPTRGRGACKYNHDIFSEENLKVLKNHELTGLNEDELRVLLLQNDPFFLPDVCRAYNKGDGDCSLKENCPKLHICHFFIKGECRFPRCKRSHNLMNPTALGLLLAEGVNDNVAWNIQKICEHKTLALFNDIRVQRDLRPAVNVQRVNPVAGNRRGRRHERTSDHSSLTDSSKLSRSSLMDLELGTEDLVFENSGLFSTSGGNGKPSTGDQDKSKSEDADCASMQKPEQAPVKNPLVNLSPAQAPVNLSSAQAPVKTPLVNLSPAQAPVNLSSAQAPVKNPLVNLSPAQAPVNLSSAQAPVKTPLVNLSPAQAPVNLSSAQAPVKTPLLNLSPTQVPVKDLDPRHKASAKNPLLDLDLSTEQAPVKFSVVDLHLSSKQASVKSSLSDPGLSSGVKVSNISKPPSAEKKKSEEICLYYVWRFCKNKNDCSMVHYHLPYRWQIQSGVEWKDCANMEEIEKAYCDPNNISFPALNINFKSMLSYINPIRRLSTPSSVMHPAKFVMTTKWLWYWKNDLGQWIEYGKPDGQRPGSNLSSDDLENVFLSDPNDSIQFQAGSQHYEINFKEMTQKNLHYLTQRELRRRPKFVSAEDVKKKKGYTDHTTASASASELNYPNEWNKSMLPEIGYKAIEVSKTSPEFAKLEQLFQKTMSTYVIHKIRRIQNPSLWQVFQWAQIALVFLVTNGLSLFLHRLHLRNRATERKSDISMRVLEVASQEKDHEKKNIESDWQKDQMKKKRGGQNVDERLLFHGTSSPSVLEAICNENFDWRICGTNGTVYGKGSYFARDAHYSHNYCQRDAKMKTMFVAQVLVGDFAPGHASYNRPPAKSAGSINCYDSCVDNLIDPSIFVIFEKHQIYPAYMIDYAEEEKKCIIA